MEGLSGDTAAGRHVCSDGYVGAFCLVVYVGQNDVTLHSIDLYYSSCVLTWFNNYCNVQHRSETEVPSRHSVLVKLKPSVGRTCCSFLAKWLYGLIFPFTHLVVSGHVAALA